jgi:hypothetical protein
LHQIRRLWASNPAKELCIVPAVAAIFAIELKALQPQAAGAIALVFAGRSCHMQTRCP